MKHNAVHALRQLIYLGWWRGLLLLALAVAGAVLLECCGVAESTGLGGLTHALLAAAVLSAGTVWLYVVWTQWRKNQRMQLLIRLAEESDSALIIRTKTDFLYISPRIEEMIGYPEDVLREAPGFFDERIVLAEDRDAWRAYQRGLWQDSGPTTAQCRFRIRHPESGVRWLAHEAVCRWEPMLGQRVCRCILRDESEVAALRQAVARLQREDRLTGLLARGDLWAQMRQVACDGAEPVTWIMLDMAAFYRINMRYGVETGDAVLAEMGVRLLQLRQRHERVLLAARWLSDNFLMAVSGDAETAETLLNEWLRGLGAQVFVRTHRLMVEIALQHALQESRPDACEDQRHFEALLNELYQRLHRHKRDAALSGA